MSEIIHRSTFTQSFVALNYPGETQRFRWCFLPGMLFQDSACWWKESRRWRCHEGVDFCRFYAGGDYSPRFVGADLVPTLFEGEVVKVEDDLLASTIWIRHETISYGNMVLFSALAHVEPAERVRQGTGFGQGEAIATIGCRKDCMPMTMHLHVSLFWAPNFLKISRLSWRQLSTLKEIRLSDPLRVIGLSP